MSTEHTDAGSSIAPRGLRRAPTEAWCAAAALLFVTGVSLYRFVAIKQAVYPGHADPALYYNVAQNIRAGHGPTVNYQWEFLSGEHPLPQYAFGYWFPLASVLMSLGLHVGSSLTAALAVNVIMSIVLAIGVYLLARAFTATVWAPALAAVVVVVQPDVSRFAVQSEAAIYLAAFAVAAMVAAVHARRRAWLWPVAGVLAGLANLSRSEGLLLFVLVLIAALGSEPRLRRGVARAASVAIPYGVVMSPLYWEDLRHFSSLMPPASGAFPYITTYENLFALHVPRTLSALFNGGVGDFLLLRARTFEGQISTAFTAFDPVAVVVILALLGVAVRASRRATTESSALVTRQTLEPSVPVVFSQLWVGSLRLVRGAWFVPGGFVVVTFLFYALVAPVVAGSGAVLKGMTTVVPIAVVGAVVILSRTPWRRSVRVAVALVLAGAPLLDLAAVTRGTITLNNQIGLAQASLKPSLLQEAHCLGKAPVLMTRDPWEFTQATGLRSVMIPNDPIADILATARRYGVTDIQATTSRKALTDIPKLIATGVLLAPSQLQGTQIYRVIATTPNSRCS